MKFPERCLDLQRQIQYTLAIARSFWDNTEVAWVNMHIYLHVHMTGCICVCVGMHASVDAAYILPGRWLDHGGFSALIRSEDFSSLQTCLISSFLILWYSLRSPIHTLPWVPSIGVTPAIGRVEKDFYICKWRRLERRMQGERWWSWLSALGSRGIITQGGLFTTDTHHKQIRGAGMAPCNPPPASPNPSLPFFYTMGSSAGPYGGSGKTLQDSCRILVWS